MCHLFSEWYRSSFLEFTALQPRQGRRLMYPSRRLNTSAFANAALVVTVDQPKISGSKAVVTLTMKNTLTEQIESARAAVFLLDEQGKMVVQSTKWVIGSGPNNAKSALPSPLAQILQLRRKR